MTAPTSPLSRPVLVTRLPGEGSTVLVEASATECAAVAADLRLPAIQSLKADFRVRARHGRVHVTGQVVAEIEEVCVVSLEPFGSRIEEPVDVFFAEASPDAADVDVDEASEHEVDLDRPDTINDGRIDLGQLAAEFLALGLDPYPRKPGIVFEGAATDPATASPFAKLAAMKARE